MTELEMENLSASQLLGFIRYGLLPDAQLTFAAEIAGRKGHPETARVLFLLLKHDSALVREGAIYGLEHIFEKASGVQRFIIRWVIRRHTKDSEPSREVRIAAKQALEL